MADTEKSYAGPRKFWQDPTAELALRRIKPKDFRPVLPRALKQPDVKKPISETNNPLKRNRYFEPGEIVDIRKRIRDIEIILQRFNKKRRLNPEEQKQVTALRSELKPLKTRLQN